MLFSLNKICNQRTEAKRL